MEIFVNIKTKIIPMLIFLGKGVLLLLLLLFTVDQLLSLTIAVSKASALKSSRPF